MDRTNNFINKLFGCVHSDSNLERLTSHNCVRARESHSILSRCPCCTECERLRIYETRGRGHYY
ncbi:unnamed protein product [Brassica rapa subsp. narinosa]